MKAAVGVRTHSGWAALVALAGAAESPTVLVRQRIELSDPGDPESKQPYHAAEGLELGAAERLLKGYSDTARTMAQRGLRDLRDQLERQGGEVIGCGMLLGSGRPGSSLAAILASHALIHTADGDHFRDALRHACDTLGWTVTGVREKELLERGSAALGLRVEQVQQRVTELGRSQGPPWGQDQKYAALVAWLVLGDAGARKARAGRASSR